MNEWKAYQKCKIRTIDYCLLFFLGLLLLLFMTGCNNTGKTSAVKKDTYITKTDFLLNTVITINLYDKQDEKILQGCFDLISQYEQICSATSETSQLYALNHGLSPKEDGFFQISDELADVIKYGLFYGKKSGGAFDISIEPVSSQWNFITDHSSVPDDKKIKAVLPLINYKNIDLNGIKIRFLKDGMQIDLGGIAKGYIADRVKEYVLDNGVHSAMINLGGNVLCVGEKPDGTPFHVGIQKPFADRNVTVAVMDIKDLSVVSSGVYERFFEVNGKLYHHILDPKTGYPYDNGLISVTILSKQSVDGDGLSTTCFALGLEKGLDLIAGLPDIYAVFITEDYQIHYSKGFQEAIPIKVQE